MVNQDLKNKYNNYLDMVEFCTEGCYVSNSELIQYAWSEGFNIETFASPEFVLDDEGNVVDYNYLDQDEWSPTFCEYYIISPYAANMFKRYTYEYVFYIEEFDVYLLGITHCGTYWGIVSSNWR